MPLCRALLLCLAGSFCSPLLASDLLTVSNSPRMSSFANHMQYFIKYQNQRLPKWRFDVRMNRRDNHSVSVRYAFAEALDLTAVSVSARRALTASSKQWVYATLRNTHYIVNPQVAALPLISDTTTTAGIGWQFGDPYGFGLAMGYEIRYVGDENDQSLVMGVHYFF